MGSGGRVGQLQILGRHNVCHALHFCDDDDDDIAWYGIGLFVGVVLLLPSPLRRRSPPRPCVDARHDAGTSPLVDLTLDVVAFFVSGGKFIVGTGSATFSGRYLWLGLRWWSCKICG